MVFILYSNNNSVNRYPNWNACGTYQVALPAFALPVESEWEMGTGYGQRTEAEW